MKQVTKELFAYIAHLEPTENPLRDLNKMKSLIDQGAEMDKVHPVLKKDILTIAIRNTKSKRERLAIVKLLVESRAKINFKHKVGPSPINSAIDALDLKVTRYLLENGAIIKTERDLNASKMIEKDKVEFLDLLLKNGLDVNSKTSYPSKGGAEDEITIPGNTLLIDAVDLDAIKIIEYLLANNVDINYTQPFMGSAVSRAIHYNRIEALKLLLEAGGNPNEIVSPQGISILRKAIQRGYLECIQLLLQHGAIIKGSYLPEDLENKNISPEIAAQISSLMG